MHRWDSKTCQYRIEESSPVDHVTELDEYVFIVRARISEQNEMRQTLATDWDRQSFPEPGLLCGHQLPGSTGNSEDSVLRR